MQAVIFQTDGEFEQHEVCRLVYRYGQIAPSNDSLCGKRILETPVVDWELGRQVTARDGEVFLAALPKAYSGSRLRVGLQDDGGRPLAASGSGIMPAISGNRSVTLQQIWQRFIRGELDREQFSELWEKYNPHHDPATGRFSSGGGGGVASGVAAGAIEHGTYQCGGGVLRVDEDGSGTYEGTLYRGGDLRKDSSGTFGDGWYFSSEKSVAEAYAAPYNARVIEHENVRVDKLFPAKDYDSLVAPLRNTAEWKYLFGGSESSQIKIDNPPRSGGEVITRHYRKLGYSGVAVSEHLTSAADTVVLFDRPGFSVRGICQDLWLRFNPHHDERGRFASSSGGSFGGGGGGSSVQQLQDRHGMTGEQAGWAATMISRLESIFSGPGRAAAINEVLSATKYPEYLKGILSESPGIGEIEAVVAWSIRRGRMWEAA